MILPWFRGPRERIPRALRPHQSRKGLTHGIGHKQGSAGSTWVTSTLPLIPIPGFSCSGDQGPVWPLPGLWRHLLAMCRRA